MVLTFAVQVSQFYLPPNPFPQMKDSKENIHTPNPISTKERTKYIVLAAAMLIYATFAWYRGEVYIPGRSGSSIRFTGTACTLIYCGLIAGAASCISVVVDHYDKRNNEANYQKFAMVTRTVSIALLALGTVGSILYDGLQLW